MILGVPIGTYLSCVWGWRTATVHQYLPPNSADEKRRGVIGRFHFGRTDRNCAWVWGGRRYSRPIQLSNRIRLRGASVRCGDHLLHLLAAMRFLAQLEKAPSSNLHHQFTRGRFAALIDLPMIS